MTNNTSMASRTKISKETRQRVQRRREIANVPYIARRRDFTPNRTKRVNVRGRLLKVAVWAAV